MSISHQVKGEGREKGKRRGRKEERGEEKNGFCSWLE